MRHALRIFFVAATISVAGAQVGTTQFEDPAPPKVHHLEPMPPPDPAAYPELQFHRPPMKLADGAVTEDWPGFLGPRRDSRSRETKLSFAWPPSGPPLVWETARGQSYASPVIQGTRLVHPHRVGSKVHVDCLHTETGQRYWRFTYPTAYRGVYISNSGPRATPTISDGRVYIHGVQGLLHCLDLTTGRLIWKRDLARELRAPDGFFGVVSSPLVVGNLLVQNVGGQGGPCVVAFDKKTGRIVWGSGDRWGASCASPVLGQVHGRDRLFVLAGGKSRPPVGGLMVLDPTTGAVDFEYPFRSRTYESVIATSPLVLKDQVFLSSGYGVGSAVLGMRPDGKHVERWKSRDIMLQFQNAVFVRGGVWVVDGIPGRSGAVVCIDPATGKEISRTDLGWEEAVGFRDGRTRKASFSVGEGSLLHVDGGFLCLGDQGHLLRLRHTPDGVAIVARAWLFRAMESWTPVGLSRGLLYVCQNKLERYGEKRKGSRLLCFDLRGK